jgi:integrase
VTVLLRIINAWGSFVSKRLGSFYEQVPAPKAAALTLIRDQYQKSKFNREGGSSALTPEVLKGLRDKIAPEQFDWLSLSVYFGLRPIEVELLKSPKHFKIEFDKHEVPVLHVNQTKLRHSSGQTWKAIPCVLKEQVDLLMVIQAGQFNRPLAKTIQSYTKDERLTLYGGRKGFADLMLDNGQDLQDISLWLGHAKVDRTWRNYMNKQRVSWKPVKRKA